MLESSTYQKILRDGEIAGAQRMILRMGKKKYGPPSSSIEARLLATKDAERLEQVSERLFVATSWEALLVIEEAAHLD